MKYKVAIATDDGVRVAPRFGHAEYFAVFNVERGKMAGWELRANPGVGKPKIGRILAGDGVAPFLDCKAVICMDAAPGVSNKLRDIGLELILTHLPKVEDAMHAYLDGYLSPVARTRQTPRADTGEFHTDWA